MAGSEGNSVLKEWQYRDQDLSYLGRSILLEVGLMETDTRE